MRNYKLQITNYKIAVFASVVILFTTGCTLPWQRPVDQQEGHTQEEATQTVTLKITNRDGKTYEYPIEYKEGLAAFDLFTWAGIRTATKQYDFGVYVDVIEGVKGEKGYYWIYYINGTPAMQAADQYKVQPNDVIEWKYEAEKAGL